MGKSLAIVVRASLLLACLGPCLAPASADMPVDWHPGTHAKTDVATVELGPWEGYTVRFLHVEAGDTLGGIAREHLGSFKRWKEVLELNPVDPQSLPLGAELLLPPRHEPLPPTTRSDPKRPDARVWWDFFVFQGAGGKLVRHRPEKPLPPYGVGTRLVAVRHDKTAEVLKRVAEAPAAAGATLDALAPTASAWLARSDTLTRSIRVQDEDPVYKVEIHWRVTDIAEGKIRLARVSQRHLGYDGKEVQPLPAPQPVGSQAMPPANATTNAAPGVVGPPARWDLILTFLALLAAIGIAVVYAQRARRRATGEPASSATA